MACFHPLTAGRYLRDGKPITAPAFGSAIEAGMTKFKVRCGQCIGCRLDHSLMWATRMTHESRSFESNCFITLTYSDKHLPSDLSIHLSHMQKFWKRLRSRTDANFKHFYCGEYGEKKSRPIGPFNPSLYHSEGQRPHYHACIFGYDFPDQELFTVRDGYALYTSDLLADVWGQGHCTVAPFTFETAAYVARYTLKKVNGKLSQKPDPLTGLLPYERCCPITGNITEVTPEFAHMSRGGRHGRGIGFTHYNNYRNDIYPADHIIHNGRQLRPPKYYDALYDIDDPESMEEIKARRCAKMEQFAPNNTRDRLATREKVKKAQLTQLKRGSPNEE